MGENPDVPGRESVRTPMQWSDERNGGFSRAPRNRLVAPIPGDGYAPEHVNALKQRSDSESLLRFMHELITRYRTSPEIGWGTPRVLDHDAVGVLAHEVVADVGRMVAVHNFTDVPVRFTLDLGPVEEGTVLVDVHGTERLRLEPRGQIELELAAYGHRWLRVSPPGDTRIS